MFEAEVPAEWSDPGCAWSDEVAFPTFLVDQVVGVGVIVAIRGLMWPRELSYLAAAILSVVGSLAVGRSCCASGSGPVIGTRRR